MTCRICLEEGNTTSVCDCKGTHGQVHLECVRKWVEHSGKTECEICHVEYRPKVESHQGTFILGVVNVLGVVNAVLHSYLGIVLAGSDKALLYSLVFNFFAMLLWVKLYLTSTKKDSIAGVTVWVMLYFIVSVLLQLSYRVEYVYLLGDYALTIFVCICCCVQSIRK